MTAERIDMADPDNLLLLDTEAVSSSLASAPIEQSEPARASNAQTDDSFSPNPDPASESSGIMPVPCRDGTVEIHSQNIHKEGEHFDIDTGAAMKIDNIMDSNSDLIHITDTDNMTESNQKDKHTDVNTIEDTNLDYGTLMSPELSSLVVHNKQEEMSKGTISNQYPSFESISQAANDGSVLVNTVSSVLNIEQSPDQPSQTHKTDATSSESVIQICSDTPKGVEVAVEAVTADKTPTEMDNEAQDLLCDFTISETDANACLAEADAPNLTHSSILLDSLGVNILETADVLVNDSQMIQAINKDSATPNAEVSTTILTQTVENLLQVSAHDESESNMILDQYASSENVGLEVGKSTNNDNYMVSDVINIEQSLGQPSLKGNNETPNEIIHTYQDTHEGVDKTLPEMHDSTEDLPFGGFTISTTTNTGDLKTDSPMCLPEEDAPNLTHASILLDSSGINNVLETADGPEIIQSVNEDLVTPNAELSTTLSTHIDQNLTQLSETDAAESVSNRTDTILDHSSKSDGLEVSINDNNDCLMLNTVSDAISNEQPFLISNNETGATSSESLIQTFQDTPEGVDVAAEVTAYKALPEMHDEAEDLTCCGFTTSQIPKIEEPKTDNPSLAELHKADTPNILTHACALLDSLGMNNSVLETADVPVNDNDITHTVNKDLASSRVEFCANTVTETNLNLENDDVEMESNIIDDSIDSMNDTTFPFNEPCSKNPSATVVNSESPSMPETPETNEKSLSQVTPGPKPVTNSDLDKCSEEIEGACLKFKGTERDVEAGSELWLDACQFLAGEEDEGAIFDKWGRSCSPTPPPAHLDNTKASDCSRIEDISTDHQAEDWELWFPPVERWSSSDSWASAFSDWFQAVNTYPEDSFASANTKSKLSMAIQDNILEQRTSSDNATNTGQSCLSMNLLEPDAPGQTLDRGLVESDNANGALFKQGDADGLPSHSDSDRQENTTMESFLETLTKSESHKPEKDPVMDTFSASKSCVSSANEVNAKPYGSQHISGELLSAKLEGNVLVTEGKIPRFGLVFEEERECSFPSPRISAYISGTNLTGGVSDREQLHSSDVDLCISPSQSDSDVSSKAGLVEGNGSLVHANTVDCTLKPKDEEKNTIPQFIMPLAPLGTGNTFFRHGFLKTDSPQCELDLHPKITINEINFKSDQKSISSDDSSEDCFHTCPDQSLSSSCGDSDDPSMKDIKRKAECSDTCDISKELSKILLLTGERFMLSENKRVAYVTLDLEENLSLFPLSNCEEQPKPVDMPHKTSKTSSESKPSSKHKEKPDDRNQNGIQSLKKHDVQPPSQLKNELNLEEARCEDRPVTVIETIVITEKVVPKTPGKKKKKHVQHGTPKPENDQSSDGRSRCAQQNTSIKTEILDVSNGLNKSASQPSTKMDITNKDSTQKVVSVRPKVETSGNFTAKKDPASINATQKASPIKLKVDSSNTAKTENKTCTSDSPSTCLPSTLNEDVKRRRIADDLSGAVPIRTRPQLPAIFRHGRKDGEDTTRRAYSEVVKQKTPTPKEVVLPRVVSEIQADPVPADPQNISLWCQFSPVPPDATIKWTKEGTTLSEINKIENDDGRFTLTIMKACSKDLGLYKCSLNAANISVSTAEYHLTSEVLMELVIPSHDEPAEPRVLDGDEENIQCSPLLFKEDFLLDQYFGENQPASILTEKVHFGEGMHRKAFRTTLRESNLPRFNPGHPCVLKVHNAIGYGTKTNEELVQKNYSLAMEECHVQNTAREYIKAYNSVAKSAESFGEVPEIIPIYLVHRPSNNIPYATLEEELMGDFVKYSVKDGKEINLMRRDSEAGQKCCAFQHWVYTQTDGNLLVTDMQGVGMKLTDVGIATCKKGYKGFRGNCSTSFIDQFKALHQCNRYCELLGLVSLQPKPKRPVAPQKPKTQPTQKKKPFGPVLKSKS